MIPNNSGRLIAIADIHGHADRLKAILKAIDPQLEDTLVFLGDFVDRGPDSKGVIDEILNLSNICNVCSILGNHEEMILAAYQGGKSEHNFWCKFGGLQALASYGVSRAKDLPIEHLNFIAKCEDCLESDDFIFVHAWCDPDISIDKNSGETLRWTTLPKVPTAHSSGKTVICGHTAQKQILDFGHTCCIDTGCGIFPGGKLTALDVKSGKIWQIGGRSKKVSITQRS